ncbi:hypothetical protein JC862_13105 [Morganella morganii]|nr:hypothetical protein [Morganella morganii]QXO45308.1 hypothetical protein JC862_13105 [Morganella morganii]
MKKIMAIIIFCFSFHAYAELNITPINDDFDYSNNLKYNESIRKLRSELSDHSSGYGKNVYISEKENKLYRIKIYSDEKKNPPSSALYIMPEMLTFSGSLPTKIKKRMEKMK